MTPSLLPASEVRPGDLLENHDRVWVPVMAIHKEFGRLYFILGPDRIVSRSGLMTDLLLVGRE